ncbi:MAG: group 1 truncated hemoglobin [Bacteriovorax sp.]|nr:group 1 truncated hemoglobin [Bacteriovorax sp.]
MNQPTAIYDKYGGYNFFHRCIYDLYLEMFDHPEIAYHFVGVNIEKLSRLQTQFLVRAIGGPDLYEGKVIKNVHAHMEITPYEFKEIAKSFRNVFIKNGVEKADVDIIMSFVASHSPDIVTVKTTFISRLMKNIYRWFDRIKKALF